MKTLHLFVIYLCLVCVASQLDFPDAENLELSTENGTGIVESDDDASSSLAPDSQSDKKKLKKSSWNMIYPGTKWCGRGNTAQNEEDFGKYRRTDMCCRAHDRCPVKVKGKNAKYGIINNSSTSIQSCECDETFYDCLKGVRTKVSKIIGILYFDILKNDCLRRTTAEGDGEYTLSKTRRFSNNRIIKLISKIG